MTVKIVMTVASQVVDDDDSQDRTSRSDARTLASMTTVEAEADGAWPNEGQTDADRQEELQADAVERQREELTARPRECDTRREKELG